MTEYPQHIKAKKRVAELLAEQANIQNIKIEYDTGIYVPTTLGPKPYIADVYAEQISATTRTLMAGIRPLVLYRFAVEVDGKYHSKRKNDRRDMALKEHGIVTVRFPTKWLVGKKAVTDDDILRQIDWALKQ